MTSHSTDPGMPGQRPDRDKPRIWATGRQRPGFDLRAYLRVSLGNARALASPVLGATAVRLGRFAVRVEEGTVRVPAARLGRTGRLLPSHAVTGRRLRDTAALLSVAGQAAGGAPPLQGLTFRGWDDAAGAPTLPVGAPPIRTPAIATLHVTMPPIRTPEPSTSLSPAVPFVAPDATSQAAPPAAQRPALQRPRRPAPLVTPERAEADRDTLEAIRSLVHSAHVEPTHPQRRPPVPAPALTGAGALPELAPAEPSPRGPVFRLTGQVLGAASVALAFPLGMAQAGLALARGEDLRLIP